MRKILDMLACLLLATVLASAVLGPAHATPPNMLMGSVAVCDPYSPQACWTALLPSSTGALAANQVVKATAGALYGYQVSVDSTLSAAAWWVMIYDATAAPVDGAVTPAKCYALASGTTHWEQTLTTPLQFRNGIVIGVSTTGCFTKTASTHAFISGDAQ